MSDYKRAGDQLTNVDALRRIAWSKQITQAALLRDPIMNIPSLTGTIDPGSTKKMVPGKCIQDVTPAGDDKVTMVTMLTLLRVTKKKFLCVTSKPMLMIGCTL